MIVEELKNSILLSAFQGNLSTRNNTDTKVENTLELIAEEKQIFQSSNKNIKKNQLNAIKDEEIPFSIPSQWVWVRWGTLSNSIQYGLNAGALAKGNIKLVRISDIQNNNINWSDVPYSSISEKDISQYVLKENDILFARTGGTVGKSVVVKNIPNDISYVFAGYLIRSNYSQIVNYKFLKFFMESSLYWDQLKKGTIGSAQPNCNGQTLSNMLIPFPPIEEQQRIVNKVEKLFLKLEEIKPIETELNLLKNNFTVDFKNSLLDYAICGKITKQNLNDKSVKDLIPAEEKCIENRKRFILKLIESEFPFIIPNNWKWVKLGMLCGYQNGYSYKPSECAKNGKGYPIVKSQNIMKKVVEFTNATSYILNPNNNMLKSVIKKGDLLMCLSSQSDNPEPLGKTAIYEFDFPALLNQRVLKLTPYDNRILKYLYYVINSLYFHYNVSHKGGGSAQSNLKLEHVMEMYIPLPPLEEQQRIVDKIEKLLPICEEINELIK